MKRSQRVLPFRPLRSITRVSAMQELACGAALLLLAATGCGRAEAHSDSAAPDAPSAPLAPPGAVSVDSEGTPVFQEGNSPPPVSLGGVSPPIPNLPPAAGTTRVAALAWQTPVHQAADPDSAVLGYLRVGAVVSAHNESSGSKGCPGGWVAISPFGFVCLANDNATSDLNHELVRATTQRPDITRTLPYMYGIVRRPGPIYARLPTREQAEAAESELEKRMRAWLQRKDEDGAAFRADYWLRFQPSSTPPDPASLWEQHANVAVPWFLQDGRLPPGNLSGKVKNKGDVVVDRMSRHNGFALVDTAVFHGRRYAITTDLLVVPVDRLRPIEGSSFHGYEIPTEIDFPFAIVRRPGAFTYAAEGKTLRKASPVERRAAIKLTGKQKFFRSVLHFETADGLWVSDREVSRLDPARKMPGWGKSGERWLDINITKQTLVAYEGTRPVFATLVSTGEAGLGDPETSRATVRGIFRIDRKHVTATMDSEVVGEEFELRDIPYVQYFEGGYALHAAYWHDDFGTPRSHGCINLAPEDARRLFFWTEPKLPPGWHSVRRPLTGSVLFVHP